MYCSSKFRFKKYIMRIHIRLFVLLVASSSFLSLVAQSASRLWYNKPAQYFEETLVLVNGKLGATVFGETSSDKIYLNDATLWTGEPVNANMFPDAYKLIPGIREALKNENYAQADKLNKKVQGLFSQSYAPLGTLKIDFGYKSQATNYSRELDLTNAISTVKYAVNGINYKREYFVSYPDKILIIKISADKKASVSFKLNFDSELKYKVQVTNNILNIDGQAPYYCAPSYKKNDKESIRFDDKKGTRFSSIFKINNTGGKLLHTDSTIAVSNANEAIIYVSIATSFNGFDKNPATEGLNNKQIAADILKKATAKPFAKLQGAHIADYRSFFNRVTLQLGKSNAPELPTNERLKRYAEGKEDKNLEILYFNFARYLLISSSRTPGVPANLQGIWNPYMRPPWSSNYTTNINVEENYWLAETTNLSEMHLPLMGFIENASKTGAVTAKTFYGAGGWCVCHNSDIWAMSNPVGNSGEGDPSWANWNMGGAWLSTHLWEHYQFSRDEKFLRDKAFPLMKGAAQFCLDWLVEDQNGNLITSPSTSPENKYITSEGYKGATLYGGTADLAMIRECFLQTIEATKVLNTDEEFRGKLEQALDRMHQYQIGKKGNLQEWYFDWEDVDPQHRHQSHLFGLFPGNHINPDKTPGLANACRRTLEIKGDETTGWSKGWRINLWARLWDGNHAYKMLRELLKYVDPDGYKGADKRSGGGTYPNLFDAHPPFQIDGNFGGAAAVAEMLMQSNGSEIRLLPALPDAWDEGAISGLKARGNFSVSMKWKANSLTEVDVTPWKDSEVTLISTIRLNTTETIDNNLASENGTYKLTIKLKAGMKYHFSPMVTDKNYVFAYFNNNGQDGLHMAGSHDGLTWKAFNNDQSFIAPKVGKDSIMRDPCIIRGMDGQFHMVWTDSWTDKGIGSASSPDLMHWSEQVFIPVMQQEDSARNCWAPEITLDPINQTYIIYWATTIKGTFMETASKMDAGYNHRIYYITTKDFKTFSDKRLLYDPGFNVIDATIVRDGGRYIMFMKDETREPAQKNLKIAFSENLTGPYSAASKPITGNYWAEGPTAMRKDNSWLVYFDKYREHKYGAIQSDDLVNWRDISDQISLPKGLRHGTIFTVNENEFNLLEKQ
jgi:alpha-L-fucosidase 2